MVAKATGVPLVDVYATATFYHSFSLKPKGKHIVQCCLGTACHVRGGTGIAEELEQKLGIARGETTPDEEFSLETVNCLGACALGPVVVVDGHYFPKVRRSQISQILREATAASDEADPARNGRLLAIRASCPHCEHSLMDDSVAVDGRSAIRLGFRANGWMGTVSLSSLYGSDSLVTESPIEPGTLRNLLCPHCEAGLNGSWECHACGASMATLSLQGGGEIHFCSRHGCQSRLLDLDAPRH